jgi:transcriptional repressor NrdR
MRCPYCQYDEDRVVDSRLIRDNRAIRRRRHCEGCGKRYTTYETIEDEAPFIVKKDGRRQPYDRAKLLGGLIRACEKRPVGTATVESFVDRLEASLAEAHTREVPSSQLGEEVMAFLRDTDPIAYIRFASVYRSYSDIQHFIEEIQQIGEAEKGLV